ncbi:MAG: hypothetical protein ACKVPZ_00155 [Burkholderiaceae bacterium]
MSTKCFDLKLKSRELMSAWSWDIWVKPPSNPLSEDEAHPHPRL